MQTNLKITIMEDYMNKKNLSSLQKNHNKELYMTKTNSLQKQQNKIKELFMTKKLLSVLLVLSVLCSSAFAASNYYGQKSIGIITFQGSDDQSNVSLSSLFAIKLSSYENLRVISGKGEYTQIEIKDTYGSLYSSSYENEAVKIAKKLDVNYILLGQVNKLGNQTKLIIRVIDTKGNHISGAQCTFENPEEIQDFISKMCNTIVNGINSSTKSYQL